MSHNFYIYLFFTIALRSFARLCVSWKFCLCLLLRVACAIWLIYIENTCLSSVVLLYNLFESVIRYNKYQWNKSRIQTKTATKMIKEEEKRKKRNSQNDLWDQNEWFLQGKIELQKKWPIWEAHTQRTELDRFYTINSHFFKFLLSNNLKHDCFFFFIFRLLEVTSTPYSRLARADYTQRWNKKLK